MKQVDLHFFPGWVRKAITFTIDDGNIAMDTKWLDIVKPAGIKGTFNLNAPLDRLPSAEAYREFYRGYGVANHSYRHPEAHRDGEPMPKIRADEFDPDTADHDCYYKTEVPGFYHYYEKKRGFWRYAADPEGYINAIRIGQEELVRVFGITEHDFVWPYGIQANAEVVRRVAALGCRSVRATGIHGFDLPADRGAWSYNATHQNLAEQSRAFDDLPDDGTLKWLCLGVHSIDYERAGAWGVLQEFCDAFGNRPEKYWSAPVGEIFAYEDAIRSVVVTEDTVKNPSDVKLYIKVDGVRKTLMPHSELKI